MNKIFYIMGKSASGKDTIFKTIQEKMPQLKTIVIYTTRPIREGETEGIEYHFVSEKELEEFQRSGKVIELRAYDTIHGIWNYFTVDDGQFSQDCSYLTIGTLESYRAMKSYFGSEKVIPIFIEVEDGIRLERALKREQMQKQPKYEELCRRFLADAKDFSEDNLRTLGITFRFVNENMDKCVQEIMLYIRKYL